MRHHKPQQALAMRKLIVAVVLASLATATNHTAAATIFESGTLGPTGIPMADLNHGTVPSVATSLWYWS